MYTIFCDFNFGSQHSDATEPGFFMWGLWPGPIVTANRKQNRSHSLPGIYTHDTIWRKSNLSCRQSYWPMCEAFLLCIFDSGAQFVHSSCHFHVIPCSIEFRLKLLPEHLFEVRDDVNWQLVQLPFSFEPRSAYAEHDGNNPINTQIRCKENAIAKQITYTTSFT